LDKTELMAHAASMGMVLLPVPPEGMTYVERRTFDSLTFVDSSGERKRKVQKERKNFTKFYGEVWESLGRRKALGANESHLLINIFPYCETNSNFLVDKQNGVPLDIVDIAKLIGREERQTRRILKSLVDKNMMARVESGECWKYAVNPELYWKGGDITKYDHFKIMFYTFKENRTKDAKEQLKTLYVNGKKTSILH